MAGRKFLGKLKNGASVYDRDKSHIHTEYDKIYELIDVVLPYVNPPSDIFFHYSHDFKKVVGESICVPTETGDDVVYAQRFNRKGLTRFIKNKKARPTSVFTVVLKRDENSQNKEYILITAYIGEKAPEEPWDRYASETSIRFWNTHALIWESVPVNENTETSVCPW